MTPWDAWDYDGINEHLLADVAVGGKKVKALIHFDRNGFGYTLDRTNGTLLTAQPFVSINWAKSIDMKTGRPVENPDKRTKQGADTKDICPGARWAARINSRRRSRRADQPRLPRQQQHLHELRGRRGGSTPPVRPMSAPTC
jgi:glucose dehydrogenase